MTLTSDSTVAEIATEAPATIAIFQHHQIDFCCGGKIPLAEACRGRGLDVDAVLDELRTALSPSSAEPNWNDVTLGALVDHIQHRYHEPLRAELPRLSAMLQKVISRHGEHEPQTLPALERTFSELQHELLAHMAKEDQVLFPVIVGLERGEASRVPDVGAWISAPIAMMESEHDDAGKALAFMRETTDGYTPPQWACPTFRGLYYGLSQLESDMHMHVHLENHVLFPRALRLAKRAS